MALTVSLITAAANYNRGSKLTVCAKYIVHLIVSIASSVQLFLAIQLTVNIAMPFPDLCYCVMERFTAYNGRSKHLRPFGLTRKNDSCSISSTPKPSSKAGSTPLGNVR
jgi:hypothetical protein